VNDTRRLQRAISNAVSYLESQLSSVSADPYAVSIISYALTLADRSRATDAVNMLNALAVVEGILKLYCMLCILTVMSYVVQLLFFNIFAGILFFSLLSRLQDCAVIETEMLVPLSFYCY